jgi:peptidoglycan/LPS O-acetylase OafA/YrhL
MNPLSRLSRITTAGREFIPQIDGLRFLAITSVIVFHVWAIGTFHLGYPGDTSTKVGLFLSNGHVGVELFFVISGFILALPFARQYLAGGKKIRLREYFIRRVTRIEPPYVIQLVLVFLWTALVLRHSPAHQEQYGSEGWLHYTAAHMLASLFYAHDLIFRSHPYPNVVLWSLEIEVQFYLLAPFLAAVFALRNAWFRRALMSLIILVWPAAINHLGLLPLGDRLGLIDSLPCFLTGFLLVEIYLSGWLASGRKNHIWDAFFFLSVPAVVYGPAFETWIFLVVCVAAFRGRIASWLMSNPWITTIGGMCYTVYMYHWLLIAVLIRGTIHLRTGIIWLDLLVQFIVLTPMIILICAIPFALLERPFMRRDWPTRFKQFVLGTKATAPAPVKTADGE